MYEKLMSLCFYDVLLCNNLYHIVVVLSNMSWQR